MANQGEIKREVSEVLNEQRDVAASIEKLVANVGKTAHANRSSANREVKVCELDSLWKLFQENNNLLANELPVGHPYHKDQLSALTYAQVKLGKERLATWQSLKEANTAPATGTKPKANHSAEQAPQEKAGLAIIGESQELTTPGPNVTSASLIEHLDNMQISNIVTTSVQGQATGPAGYYYVAPHETGSTSNVPISAPVPQSGQSIGATGICAQRVLYNLPAQYYEHPIMATTANASSSVPAVAINAGLQPNQLFTQRDPTNGQINGIAMSSANIPRSLPMSQDPWTVNGTRQFIAPAAPKLAPISIPAFNGEWKQWTSFIGLFESLIDTNPYLAPVQKLQYLINYLQGEARECISHIVLCNENYCVALEIVKRRYENARKICDDYVTHILDLPKMESRSAAGILNITTVLTLSLHGLKRYTYDTASWAPIIVTCVTRKMDEESRQKFEESLEDTRKVPSIAKLTEFLDRRYQVLLRDSQRHAATPKKRSFATVTAPSSREKIYSGACAMCKSTEHNVRQCERFLDMSISQRIQAAKAKQLCLNCLGKHAHKCSSRYTCKICQRNHHSLLHLNKQEENTPRESRNYLASKGDDVILATALVKVRNIFGQHETLRALIDPGSQDSFITTDAARILSLTTTPTSINVSGIGGTKAGKITNQVHLSFSAHYPNMQQFQTDALVLPKLTATLPEKPVPASSLPYLPENITLADPRFQEPGPIDLLLGAGIFAEILKEGTKKFNNNRLLLQNTELGWILTGRLLVAPLRHTHSLVTMTELDEKMRTFWEIDEAEALPEKSSQLDEFYEKTTTRDEDGRYIVTLPRKPDVYGQLGASRNMAIARLINQEKAFVKNPHLANEYTKFLREYEDMGHMTKVPPFAGPESGAYYLPHHAVVKESSTTTKVRVVFNASAKTHTGLSLNSLLEPGHKQQQDLSQIILRWRKHQVVINADIEKMFRQIIVRPEDRDMQRIVWRRNTTDPISEYQLNTVTYGTASATYLAVRTLIQLARDEGDRYPVGKEVLIKDFYMDDLVSGSDSIEGALLIQKQISKLLAKGGMNIRKWTSNSAELIKQIPPALRETGDWLLNPEATIKTLGVVWNPQRDEFRIRLNMGDFQEKQLTKRSLLSNIATIFDPLGFLAPISFACKTWMQQLWVEKTDWDERVSEDVERKWEQLFLELPLINEMTIARWMRLRPGTKCQIHGFCDASEKGYAAVVYSRIIDDLGYIHVNLLTAKTKVAPLKNKLTLPRMELTGAVLLAKITSEAIQALELEDPETFYWCDSQITLAWINKSPTSWTTFVAHRVANIQNISSPQQWRYVNTKENPADVASRGCSPGALLQHPLWWKGAEWLSNSSDTWPSSIICSTDLEQRPAVTLSHVTIDTKSIDEFLGRYSSFHRLVRITAWIRRFATKGTRTRGALTAAELLDSRNNILRLLQHQEFSDEVKCLQSNLPLPKNSRVSGLTPFIDEAGLVRVGGRLRHSMLSHSAKYPILLPRKHLLTRSIVIEAHQRTLHGGAQLTLTLLRRTYWISDGRSTVQAVLRSCLRCRRFAVAAPTQQMGDLPAARVTSSPPFTRTGVDFCGPFLYRCSQGRGIKTTKGYVSVFVCFATKAIHLELVSDLSSDAFLAALKRFISRRGLPAAMYSDNGTNFVGASRLLREQHEDILQISTEKAAEHLANDGITWNFIPPISPHFGGLWEAGVKSVKQHMKRVLDDTKLTYEEFSTVLCQIEACVNSRPLFAVSNDPADLAALTPGHFLITRPLVALPEPATLDASPVKRWELLTKIHQDFWKRWSNEYLTQLQQKSKWKREQTNPDVGELVLVKERGVPPTKWPLGRITELHPGDDKKVRVVTLRTKGKEIKQPMVNLCSLLKPQEETPVAPEVQQVATSRVSHVAVLRRSQPKPLKSVILMFLMMMMMLINSSSSTVIVKAKPGLYVERMGHCQLKRGMLRLQTQISFQEMENDEAHINALGKNMSVIFHRWDSRHEGSAAESRQFRQMYEHFEKKRSYIAERITELKMARDRVRRGALGKMFTAVFGVNDEVYTELALLQKGQLANNQNNLRVSAMLERTHQDLLHHRKQLDQSLKHSNELIHQLSLESHRHTLMHHLAAAHTNAMAYLDDSYRKYDALEKAILGRGGIMDIMPLQQVNSALRNATSRLPHGFYVRHIPEEYVATNFTSEHLTISGFFPIASAQLFDLVHVTPIPEQRNESFVMQNLAARTVALNYNDQVYFELNEGQLAACQRTAENTYLCDTPVLSVMKFDTCSVITEIFNRTGSLPCDTAALSINGVLWQKLMRPNTWMFSTNTSTMIAVICQNEREDISIMDSGIIKLDPGCLIKTETHTIQSLFYLDLRVLETFIRESILPLDSPISKSFELRDPPPFTDPMTLVADMQLLEERVPVKPFSFYEVMPWGGGGLSLLFIFCCTGLCIRRRCRQQTTKAHPCNEPPVYDRVIYDPVYEVPLTRRFDRMIASLPPAPACPAAAGQRGETAC